MMKALRNTTNVKFCLFISQHITSFLKISLNRFTSTSTINFKPFFIDIHPPTPISRRSAMNSRVSEHRNLHLSTDVDVGLCQKRPSCSGMPRWLSQHSLANSDIGCFLRHAIQLPVKELFQYKTSSIPSRTIIQNQKRLTNSVTYTLMVGFLINLTGCFYCRSRL